MICFEVIKTKDFDILGEWKFKKNSIIIGGIDSHLGDVRINNEEFTKEAIHISIKKENLFLENMGTNNPLFINSKKTTANAILFKGDQLLLGHTLLRIKDFSYQEHKAGNKISENFKKIVRSNHPNYAVIKSLEAYLRKQDV